MKLVLASKSPRRKELLSLLDLEFKIISADIDETMDSTLPVCDEVARLSLEKAKATALHTDGDSIIISADTVVELDGVVFGKPKDDADAQKMLCSLSGNTHNVLTAVTVMHGEKCKTQVVTTSVTFRKLTTREISDYIATREPMDKAGAYGIQGRASKFVEKINGDYFNIVGLPVCTLSQMLEDFNINT